MITTWELKLDTSLKSTVKVLKLLLDGNISNILLTTSKKTRNLLPKKYWPITVAPGSLMKNTFRKKSDKWNPKNCFWISIYYLFILVNVLPLTWRNCSLILISSNKQSSLSYLQKELHSNLSKNSLKILKNVAKQYRK